jgi:hypothetical protein
VLSSKLLLIQSSMCLSILVQHMLRKRKEKDIVFIRKHPKNARSCKRVAVISKDEVLAKQFIVCSSSLYTRVYYGMVARLGLECSWSCEPY